MGVPASVIVSGSSSGPAPSGHDNLLAETRQRQSPSPSLGPAHMATVVNKVDELMLCTKPHPLVAATAAYWTTVSQQISLSFSVPLSFYCHCLDLDAFICSFTHFHFCYCLLSSFFLHSAPFTNVMCFCHCCCNNNIFLSISCLVLLLHATPSPHNIFIFCCFICMIIFEQEAC